MLCLFVKRMEMLNFATTQGKKTLMKHLPVRILYIIILLLFAARPCSAAEKTEAQLIKAKGDSCYNQRKFTEAMEYFVQCRAVATKNRDSTCYAECLGAIGNIYAVFKDYERANHYFKDAYVSALAKSDYKCASLFVSDVVLTYCIIKKPDEARHYLELRKALPVSKDNQAISSFYDVNLVANIYEAEGQLDKAIETHLKSIDLCKKRGVSDYFIYSIYGELSDVYLKQGNTRKALEYSDKVISYAHKYGDPYFLVSSYEAKSRIYRQANKTDSMAKYQTLYLSMSDSVFNTPKFNNVRNQLFEYETEQTNQNIFGLKKQISDQTLVIALTITVIVLMLCILLIVFLKNRMLRRTQRALISKNQELIKLSEKERRRTCMASEGTPSADAGLPKPQESIDAGKQDELLMKIDGILMDFDRIADHDFSLSTLADMVGSNTTYVSQAINAKYGKGFKALLNELRVNEACKRLSDTAHYGNLTIEAISEGVGYNSQSHFIKVFNKQTGMNPSTYRKISTEKG